jgi:oligopeptide transport system substrate-binding protein
MNRIRHTLNATRILPITFLLAGTIIAVGCSGNYGKTNVEIASANGVLLFGNDAEPEDLDPHVVSGFTEQKILIALFEGLVTLAPDGVTVDPGVAESWDVSDDKLRYTFHLRDDAKWSNGDPVTARDFAYAWERILTPSFGSQYANMLHCIHNAKAYNTGELRAFGDVGVYVEDSHTLKVTLAYPTPYFLSMQTFFAWFPVHRATIETHGRFDERGTRWTRADNFVGNGAFKLKDWEPGSVLRVTKNPEYWDAPNVKLNGIEFYPLDNRQLEERMFRSGDLHMTSDVPLNKLTTYQNESPDRLKVHPIYSTYFYRLNVTKPPLDDVRVRRALSITVNRQALIEHVLRIDHRVAESFCPADPNGYTPHTQQTYNIIEAKQLLAEAGYASGADVPAIELLYNTSENHRLIAETIQQMWNESLGIRVDLVSQDWQVYMSSLRNLDYNIGRSSWYADYLDPISFLECFESDSGNNRTGWKSAEYDALISRARTAVDDNSRFAIYGEAEGLLIKDQPIIPLFHYVRSILLHPDVEGWQPNLLAHVPYKHLSLKTEIPQ